MEIISKLTSLARKLENKGLISLSSDVDGAASTFVKVAKELGVQGYWVQNGRCWAGCYRSKRASQPKTSAQDIWFECQEEYEKAIIGNSDSWNKYAGTNVELYKTANTVKFSSSVLNLVASGDTLGNAVFSTISNELLTLKAMAISAAESLASVSEKLATKDANLSKEAASISAQMTKEAFNWNPLSYLKKDLKPTPLPPNPTQDLSLHHLFNIAGQLDRTIKNYSKQKKELESALDNSSGLNVRHGDLVKFIKKGLRPLTQNSVDEIIAKIREAMANNNPLQDLNDNRERKQTNQTNSEKAEFLQFMKKINPSQLHGEFIELVNKSLAPSGAAKSNTKAKAANSRSIFNLNKIAQVPEFKSREQLNKDRAAAAAAAKPVDTTVTPAAVDTTVTPAAVDTTVTPAAVDTTGKPALRAKAAPKPVDKTVPVAAKNRISKPKVQTALENFNLLNPQQQQEIMNTLMPRIKDFHKMYPNVYPNKSFKAIV